MHAQRLEQEFRCWRRKRALCFFWVLFALLQCSTTICSGEDSSPATTFRLQLHVLLEDLRGSLDFTIPASGQRSETTWALLEASSFPACLSQTGFRAQDITCDQEGKITGIYLPRSNHNPAAHGRLPPTWPRTLPSLIYVELSGDSIAGELPSSWSQFSGLKYLSLQSNKINGTLPAEWSGMHSLAELQLGDNALEGSLPGGWSALEHLNKLDLRRNSLQGSIQAAWELNALDVGSNQDMCGPLTCRIANLGTAETKVGYSCSEPGTLLPSPEFNRERFLQQRAALQQSLAAVGVRASSVRTKVSAPYASALPCDDPALHTAEMQVGPFAVYDCDGWVRTLCLANTKARGELPASWATTLPKLVSVDFSYNDHLGGSLPADWSVLTQLVSLDMSFNKISGTLPASWSTLVNLKNLKLTLNQLHGTLPSAWSTLQLGPSRSQPFGHAPVLNMVVNQMTGIIPASWDESWHLDLRYNACAAAGG